jgi:hypothetical protein
MLVIRDVQMHMFEVERRSQLVAVTMDGLRELGLIGQPEEPFSDDEDAQEAQPLPPADHQAILRLVEREVEAAQGAGIETDDAILQFVSYAFLLQSDWRDDPPVRGVLDAKGMTEAERLTALHGILSSG